MRLLDISKSLRRAFGLRAVVGYWAAVAVVLTPSICIAAYGVITERPAAIVWVVATCAAVYLAGQPCGCGLAFGMSVLAMSVVVSTFQSTAVESLGGTAPVIAWVGLSWILSSVSYKIRSSSQGYDSSG